MRTVAGIDILDFLAERGFEFEDIGYRDEAAAGTIISNSQFSELLRRLGFKGELGISA